MSEDFEPAFHRPTLLADELPRDRWLARMGSATTSTEASVARCSLRARTLAIFGIADRIGARAWGWTTIADPVGLPWLLLVTIRLSLVAAPSSASRTTSRSPPSPMFPAFVGAMERLAALCTGRAGAEPREGASALIPSVDRPSDRPGGRSRRINRRARLRELVECRQGLVVPGAYDSASARLGTEPR